MILRRGWQARRNAIQVNSGRVKIKKRFQGKGLHIKIQSPNRQAKILNIFSFIILCDTMLRADHFKPDYLTHNLLLCLSEI